MMTDYINWKCPPEVRIGPKNRRRTNSLFEETIDVEQRKKFPPLYTLRENDYKVWQYEDLIVPSAKKIYVLSNSEYEAAIKLVGSWEHWEMLIANSWFTAGTDDPTWVGLNEWRKEQDLRIRRDATSELVSLARQGNVTALKILMEGTEKKRGRPSKEEIKGELKRATGNVIDFQKHIKRVLEDE